MPASPQPPPEAVAIRRAREARGLSPEQAAQRLKIRLSGQRWRHIEQGFERKGGRLKPVRGRDMVIAHMAHVVGLDPEVLEKAGRPEAAEILREIPGGTSRQKVYDDPGLQAIWEIEHLDEIEKRLAISAIEGWRAHKQQAVAELRNFGT